MMKNPEWCTHRECLCLCVCQDITCVGRLPKLSVELVFDSINETLAEKGFTYTWDGRKLTLQW